SLDRAVLQAPPVRRHVPKLPSGPGSQVRDMTAMLEVRALGDRTHSGAATSRMFVEVESPASPYFPGRRRPATLGARMGWPGDRVGVPPGSWGRVAEEGPGSTG